MKSSRFSFMSGLTVFALLISLVSGSLSTYAQDVNDVDVRSDVYEDENITEDIYDEDVRDDVYGEDEDVTEDVYYEDDYDDDETVTEDAYHMISSTESLKSVQDKDGNIAPKLATNMIFSDFILKDIPNHKKVIMNQEGMKLVVPAGALKEILGDGYNIRIDVENVSDHAKYQGALSDVFNFHIFINDWDRFNGQFPEPFEATFYVDPAKVKNWDDLVLRYFDADGNTIDYPEQIVRYNKETGEVVVNIYHFSTYGIFEVPGIGAKKQEENKVAQGSTDQGTNDDLKGTNGEATGSADGNRLPNTATNLFNLFMAGGLFVIAGAIVLVIRRKKAFNAS